MLLTLHCLCRWVQVGIENYIVITVFLEPIYALTIPLSQSFVQFKELLDQLSYVRDSKMRRKNTNSQQILSERKSNRSATTNYSVKILCLISSQGSSSIHLFGLLNVVPNLNPLGIKRFVSGISVSFKCECNIIVQLQYTKNLNPGRFELGTTLSQPNRSINRLNSSRKMHVKSSAMMEE